MNSLQQKNNSVVITYDNDIIIGEYSFILEQALNWFFAKGNFKAAIKFSKDSTILESLIKSKDIVFSTIVNIGLFYQYGFIPNDLEKLWQLSDAQSFEKDKLTISYNGKEVSILIKNDYLKEDAMATVSCDLSDIITASFLNGIIFFNYQFSINTSQIVLESNWNKEQIIDFIDRKESYNLDDLLFKS